MKKNILFSALAVVFLWLAWLIAYYSIRNDYVLPSVSATFSAMGQQMGSGFFWLSFGRTLGRTLLSFAVSCAFGILFAILSRLFRWVRAFLSPIVSVLRTTPTVAVILLLLLWASPAVAPVIVTLLVLFPAAYSAVLAALDNAAEEYGMLATVYGIGTKRKIFWMYLPLCAPDVLKQTGPILSLGLKITISGEVLAQTYRSVGGLMQSAKLFVEMPTLMALTLITVLTGFALEAIFYGLYRLIVRWRA